MKIAVIIPTFNEKENITRIISEIFMVAPEVHIFVVDDNSPDGTAGLVNSLIGRFSNLRLLNREKKEGLGRAYIYALNKVLADMSFNRIIMMDADFSHNPLYLPAMIKKSQDWDVVIGSRYVMGGQTIGWEPWRKALSFWGNVYCRLVLRTPLHDCTSGFVSISAALLSRIDFSRIDVSGYAFTIELKHLLRKQGATFFELPIVFQNRTGGESKISNHIISEGIKAPWKMIFKK